MERVQAIKDSRVKLRWPLAAVLCSAALFKLYVTYSIHSTHTRCREIADRLTLRLGSEARFRSAQVKVSSHPKVLVLMPVPLKERDQMDLEHIVGAEDRRFLLQIAYRGRSSVAAKNTP